jgi:hypothetical protein
VRAHVHPNPRHREVLLAGLQKGCLPGAGRMTALLTIQVATFLVLGGLFLAAGQWRLGLAQLLLAGVQAVLYSGRMA